MLFHTRGLHFSNISSREKRNMGKESGTFRTRRDVTGRIRDQAQESISMGRVGVLHYILSVINSINMNAYMGRTFVFGAVS